MARLGYRDIKKFLNKYHKFSFRTPPKGRDFTPQQKSAITRQWNILSSLIGNVTSDKATFIPYPKDSRLPKIDGIRTNKGVFYKYPGAYLKRVGRGKYILKINYKKLKEVFLPFPEFIQFDLERIRIWVDIVKEKLKPDYIAWSVNGYRGKAAYKPEHFDYYVDELSQNSEMLDALENALLAKKKSFYNGVYFGMRPTSKRYFKDHETVDAMALATKTLKEFSI